MQLLWCLELKSVGAAGEVPQMKDAPSAPSAEAESVPSKKPHKKKGKKKFVPLPALEALQGKLPWKVAFTQRLGRHAVATRPLQPGALDFSLSCGCRPGRVHQSTHQKPSSRLACIHYTCVSAI